MNGDDFKSWCEILWRHAPGGWVSAAGAHLGVAPRNIRYWVAGKKAIPHGVIREMGEEISRRLSNPSRRPDGLAPLEALIVRPPAG